MSSRLTRTLLKLYPRPIRNRYGEEMLDLKDELSAHGDLSRLRLIADMFVDALLVRPGRRVYSVIAAVLVIGGLAVGGAAIAGLGADPPAQQPSHPQAAASVPRRPPQPRHAPTITVPAQSGSSCFVGDGSSCSLTPCSEFIGPRSSQGAVASGSPSAAERRPRSAGTRCTAYPHRRSQRPVFVGE